MPRRSRACALLALATGGVETVAGRFTHGFSLRRHGRQDAGSALDPLAHFDAQFGLGRQQHVHARAELDEAHALAALHRVALAQVEDNAPRQQAGNLLEGDLDASSPRTVTMFCSLRSAEAGFMAFRYWPFW